MPSREKIFYGWWLIVICSVLNFLAGGTFYYGMTVFFNPIKETFGWTAATTSVGYSFKRLGIGGFSLVAGLLADRVGARKVMLFGWGIIGLSFLLMSRVNSPWSFYGSILLMSLGFSFGSFVPMVTALANWFVRKRSRAQTLILVGLGFAGVLTPLITLAIERFGWKVTVLILSFILWGVGLPLSLLIKDKPGQYGSLPDGGATTEVVEPGVGLVAPTFTVKETMKTRAFWLIVAVLALQQLGIQAVLTHIVPFLESVDIPKTLAAMVVTGLSFFMLIGRTAFGFLGDFMNKRYLIAVACVLQVAGLFIFSFIQADKTWLIILFLLIYAIGQGGPEAVRIALQAEYFGVNRFGTIMGVTTLLSMVTGLISPTLAGWLFDVRGSYRLAWQLFAWLTIPAVPLILLATAPKANQKP